MGEESKCPVDHTQRATWMQKITGKTENGNDSGKEPSNMQEACPVDHSARSRWLSSVSVESQAGQTASQQTVEAVEIEGCNSDKLSSVAPSSNVDLPTERETSSIPRTSTRDHWVYPLQKQFFDAMKRKEWNPAAADMKTVVPIHNHVNELAWRHILNWERAHVTEAQRQCGGISLTSFKGDSKKMTPRAWVKLTLFGQEPPFDRHDWTVDRCGTEVPYVIDFYSSEAAGGVFVDVRPKIQSWEGAKLRLGRALGWN